MPSTRQSLNLTPTALHFTGEMRSGSSGASAGFAAKMDTVVHYGYASPPLIAWRNATPESDGKEASRVEQLRAGDKRPGTSHSWVRRSNRWAGRSRAYGLDRCVDDRGSSGYTRSMKTAVSIPDDVFEEAERLAVELQTSRSHLYSRALQEFVARHSPDRLTEAMNRVLDEVGGEVDELIAKASRQVLERVEW